MPNRLRKSSSSHAYFGKEVPDFRTAFSENLKKLRTNQGLSQQELAAKTQLSARYISRLENSSPNVTLTIIERIVSALGSCPCELFGESRVGNPSESTNKLIDEIIRLLNQLRLRRAR
ncbi:MAG: helix-turn-helix transcriptional regulator [Deltaproteobacteria bacterium]|nr:helix-turn-helix transcriptional regulator [Deltaproteobacteria bacterium]